MAGLLHFQPLNCHSAPCTKIATTLSQSLSRRLSGLSITRNLISPSLYSLDTSVLSAAVLGLHLVESTNWAFCKKCSMLAIVMSPVDETTLLPRGTIIIGVLFLAVDGLLEELVEALGKLLFEAG